MQELFIPMSYVYMHIALASLCLWLMLKIRKMFHLLERVTCPCFQFQGGWKGKQAAKVTAQISNVT